MDIRHRSWQTLLAARKYIHTLALYIHSLMCVWVIYRKRLFFSVRRVAKSENTKVYSLDAYIDVYRMSFFFFTFDKRGKIYDEKNIINLLKPLL